MEQIKTKKIIADLKKEKYKELSFKKISESDLLEIATILKKDENYNVSQLIDIILKNNINEHCDWNIGSLLQHFDYRDIINALNQIPTNKRGYLYDSIGFCWALGECPYKDERVIEFLYEVINNARNSESWWKASFALEKITGKNAINNMKRSLKNNNMMSLEESLEDLKDKKILLIYC